MTLRIQTLPEPRPGVAALRLDGTVVRGDHRRFAAAAEACLGAGASGLVLELTDLNSISGELADEIALLWRRLSDEGAPVAVVGASVVVGWFLRRRLGEMPLLECATVEEAATAVATNSGGSEPPPVRTPRASARPSLAAVAAFLDVLGRGGPYADWTAALTGLMRSQGLGRDAHLLRCDGDRLFLDGHPDALAEAGSRLGAMLAGADAPLTLHELKAGGLTARELTFLRWSGADLVVPQHDDVGVTLERAHGVGQRLALRHRRVPHLADGNDGAAEPLHRGHEGRLRARGRLVEEVRENLPLQQVDGADVLHHGAHGLGDAEDVLEVVAAELGHGENVFSVEAAGALVAEGQVRGGRRRHGGSELLAARARRGKRCSRRQKSSRSRRRCSRSDCRLRSLRACGVSSARCHVAFASSRAPRPTCASPSATHAAE